MSVESLLKEAREVWPADWISADLFAERIAALGHASLDGLRGADLYLCAAALAGVEAACGALSDQIHQTAAATIRKMGGGDGDIDEVARDAVEKLVVGDSDRAPRIADYQGRGSLASWLRATVSRDYLNLRRKNKREVLVGDQGVLDALGDSDASDPAMSHMKVLYRAEFAAAFESALAALDDRQRAVLRYRFVDGTAVEKIAAVFGVHRATCHRWISDARAALANETERLLRARLEVSADDFAAIRQMIESQLELSLSRIFAG